MTPLFLLTILGAWFYQDWLKVILMENVAVENKIYVLATRLGLLAMFLILAVLVKLAWKRKMTAQLMERQ